MHVLHDEEQRVGAGESVERAGDELEEPRLGRRVAGVGGWRSMVGSLRELGDQASELVAARPQDPGQDRRRHLAGKRPKHRHDR
jgi:hypothetical protein